MNKQIDIPESEMGMSGYSKFSWKLWEDGICNMLGAQRADQIMRKMGYRKTSTVAAEIFSETISTIGKIITKHIESDNSLIETEVDIVNALTELKKKYENKKADNKI